MFLSSLCWRIYHWQIFLLASALSHDEKEPVHFHKNVLQFPDVCLYHAEHFTVLLDHIHKAWAVLILKASTVMFSSR